MYNGEVKKRDEIVSVYGRFYYPDGDPWDRELWCYDAGGCLSYLYQGSKKWVFYSHQDHAYPDRAYGCRGDLKSFGISGISVGNDRKVF